MTDLSIIIVNWNTCQLLANCLASIETHPPVGHSLEICVVDNSSTDGSVQMLENRFPQVHLIANEQNVGFAAANNQGIRCSTGRYLLLLNSDTEVHGQTLTNIINYLDTYPGVGLVGGRLHNPDGSLQYYPTQALTLRTLLLILWRLPGYHSFWRGAIDAEQPTPVQRVKGACMAVRRTALEDVGYMSEDYFLYAEEDDWCLRFSRSSWGIYYLPSATVTHYGGASTRQLSAAARENLYRSRIIYLRKHFGKLHALVYKMAIFLSYSPKLLALSVGSDPQHESQSLRGLLRTVRVA